MTTELQQLKAMLERAWIGHGLRTDWNPSGTAIMVETGGEDSELMITEFAFDASGKLKEVLCYQGDAG